MAWPDSGRYRVVSHVTGTRTRRNDVIREWDYRIETTMELASDSTATTVTLEVPPKIVGDVPGQLTSIAPRVPFFIRTVTLRRDGSVAATEGVEDGAKELADHIRSIEPLEPFAERHLPGFLTEHSMVALSQSHLWSPAVAAWHGRELEDGATLESDGRSEPVPVLEDRTMSVTTTVSRTDGSEACGEIAHADRLCVTLRMESELDPHDAKSIIDDMMASGDDPKVTGLEKQDTITAHTNPVSLFPYRLVLEHSSWTEALERDGTEPNVVHERTRRTIDFVPIESGARGSARSVSRVPLAGPR